MPQWLTKKYTTETELPSLIGKLAFVCKCVCPSRLFSSRILDTLCSLRRNHHGIKLSAEFRKDIRGWLHFLGVYNGISLISSQLWSAPDSFFSTDAFNRLRRNVSQRIFSCRISFGGVRTVPGHSFARGLSYDCSA